MAYIYTLFFVGQHLLGQQFDYIGQYPKSQGLKFYPIPVLEGKLVRQNNQCRQTLKQKSSIPFPNDFGNRMSAMHALNWLTVNEIFPYSFSHRCKSFLIARDFLFDE